MVSGAHSVTSSRQPDNKFLVLDAGGGTVVRRFLLSLYFAPSDNAASDIGFHVLSRD
jgi:hypothetical protein